MNFSCRPHKRPYPGEEPLPVLRRRKLENVSLSNSDRNDEASLMSRHKRILDYKSNGVFRKENRDMSEGLVEGWRREWRRDCGGCEGLDWKRIGGGDAGGNNMEIAEGMAEEKRKEGIGKGSLEEKKKDCELKRIKILDPESRERMMEKWRMVEIEMNNYKEQIRHYKGVSSLDCGEERWK